MTAEVIDFPGVTFHDLPPDKILSAAIEADLECALVIGRDKNGNLYFAGSHADSYEILWLLEIAKKALLELGED